LDAAVIRLGRRRFVLKSDPVTFAAVRIGWYVAQVNANDIARDGGATLLVPADDPAAARYPGLAGAQDCPRDPRGLSHPWVSP
jgi:hypothetical protein